MAAVVALGAFGSIIGSFLNVVVYRVPRGISIVSPRSACGSCGHEVRWHDNIPLVSWLVLRGRCRDCRARISIRYPLIELAGAAFFVLVAEFFAPALFASASATMLGSSALALAAFLYLAAISLALAVIDIETHRLPNAIVLPAYPVGVVLLTLSAGLGADLGRLISAAVGAGAMLVVYLLLAVPRPGGMGLGDVKLAGVIGLFAGWLGWAPLVVAGIGGFILGGLFGIVLLAAGRGRKTAIAFGPWMLAGAWIGILFGDRIVASYLALFGLT
ncbi:A24 family peptidase [Pseudolysinimonas kribbensis]|uniref:Prepilin peptidase n=1 Tax=Pseudolysinimonas kribbensis TaxID=433641 RepID=A0ABQ6K9J5_9MICO|nr:A24 family peptidase [Pseudolysinimonas kribbensis]GMA95650.1 prepilin peptidase [Pseudolysinimonas kribbensis]